MDLWGVNIVNLQQEYIRRHRIEYHIELDLENAKVPLLHLVVNAVKNISHNHKPKYLDKVKDALNTLSEEEINWVPYKHLQSRLPSILKEQEKYKLLLSLICCMDSIVHHRSHLAAKQFEELKHLDLSKLTWQKTDLVSKQNKRLFAQKLSTIELAQWNAGKLVTDFFPWYEEEGLSRHNAHHSILEQSRHIKVSKRKKCGKKRKIMSSKENEVAQEAMRQDNNEDKDEGEKVEHDHFRYQLKELLPHLKALSEKEMNEKIKVAAKQGIFSLKNLS